MTDSPASLNAKRFAGKPMKQPLYHFSNVEKCQRDLSGSSIQLVEKREDFVDHMAELVLLCNAAMQRARKENDTSKKSSKPLSLEYIADRLDVDDPLWGYMIRDSCSRLQGFITCTTFTNWQSTFRWDSMHDSAFAYDDDKLAQQMAAGVRKFDQDGSLAADLQSTVRCGDPWNEGIVWPRIAEISLLGGLGCGKVLVSLLLEKLEGMKATATQNYDFVVLQATENSLPFYESMGFVRVGCMTEDKGFEAKRKKLAASVGGISSTNNESQPVIEAVPVEPSSPTNALVSLPEVVSSAVITYEVERAGETVAEIAKKLDVCAFDIVFLNHCIYKEITQRSYLMKGTKLFVPSGQVKRNAVSLVSQKSDLSADSDAPQWFIAKENDTPRMIAKKFQVKCNELVEANRERLPELLAISRLKGGTRIKVSHFHIHDDQHVPYCHWTFPDDSFDQNEPSYMMARRLNRRVGAQANSRPVERSLAAAITKYVRPPNSLYATVTATTSATTPTGKCKKTPTKTPGEPKKPKRPLSAYFLYCNEYRPKVTKAGQSGAEVSKILAMSWKGLTNEEKAPYERGHEGERLKYQQALTKYREDLEEFYKAHPELSPTDKENDSPGINTLFNKVVRLKPGAVPDSHKTFEYFYVLTYIPDLQWCHLVPMRKEGTWGDEKPKAEGRPIWMLVDENQGMEVDISASFCIPVPSRAMKKTVDADEEQWDIVESGPTKTIVTSTKDSTKIAALAPIFTNRASDGLKSKKSEVIAEKTNSQQGRSATKPLTGTIERKRKRNSSFGTKKEPAGEPCTDPVSSPTEEEKPRGVQRVLPHRKAAPVSFEESSPVAKTKYLHSRKVATTKVIIATKSAPIKAELTKESLSTPLFVLEHSPKPSGGRRESHPRKAAPTFFGDPSPTPKKKIRKGVPVRDISPMVASVQGLDDSSRYGDDSRELPCRAAPTYFVNPSSAPNSRRKTKSTLEALSTFEESPSDCGVSRGLPRRKADPTFDSLAHDTQNDRSTRKVLHATSPLLLGAKRGLR